MLYHLVSRVDGQELQYFDLGAHRVEPDAIRDNVCVRTVWLQHGEGKPYVLVTRFFLGQDFGAAARLCREEGGHQ